MREYEKFLEQLNEGQREAVTGSAVPTLVVAGPGTGKTQVLAMRIAYLIEDMGVDPGGILAITFTEAGVIAMKKRLLEIIGVKARGVRIQTFHGVCGEILKEYPEYFDYQVFAAPLTEVEQYRLVTKIIEESEFQYIRSTKEPTYYAGAALSTITTLKREGVSPEVFLQSVLEEEKEFENDPNKVHEKGRYKGKMKGEYERVLKYLNRNKELAEAYRRYEAELYATKRLDFSDMVMRVIRKLKEEEALRILVSSRVEHLLIDEHQDSNRAQNELITLLLDQADEPSVFLVGDPKQAIYRFQGASAKNFYWVKKRYPAMKQVTLTENYRSTGQVLSLAHRLFPEEKALIAQSKREGRIAYREYKNEEEERRGVIEEIKRLSEEESEETIAVLLRKNSEAFLYAEELRRKGIECDLSSSENLFLDPTMREVFYLLEALYSYPQEEGIVKYCHLPETGVLLSDLYKTITFAREKKIRLYEIVFREELYSNGHLINPDIFQQAMQALERQVKVFVSREPVKAFEIILRESGLLKRWVNLVDQEARIRKLKALYDFLRNFTAGKNMSLREVVTELRFMKKEGLSMDLVINEGRGSRVKVMTAHKAKGLEFDSVFAPGLTEKQWEGRRGELFRLPRELFDEGSLIASEQTLDIEEKYFTKDDSVNLLYVILTRARRNLFLSFASWDRENRETMPVSHLSLFESELHKEKKEDVSSFSEEVGKQLYGEEEREITEEEERMFVRRIFEEGEMSVTALNNYLACPWRYFYRNLLRIPEASIISSSYGSAVHETLREWVKMKGNGGVEEVALRDFYMQALSTQSISESDKKALQKKWEAEVWPFCLKYGEQLPAQSFTEKKIEGVEIEYEGGGEKKKLRLTGNIDRIDVGEMGVGVVDYKTGNPSRKERLADHETVRKMGDYRRQLLFYKLLLVRSGAEAGVKGEVIYGEIQYVQPKENREYVRAVYGLTDGEVEGMEGLIKQVAKEIWDGEFLMKRCEDKECEYCALRNLRL